MSGCERAGSPDVELYYYGELAAAERADVEAHLRGCAECRGHLDDLRAIGRALATEPVVAAPPAGDWSGFMRRLDAAVGLGAPLAPVTRAAVLERTGQTWSVRQLAALAATLAMVTIGVLMAARVRVAQPAGIVAQQVPDATSEPVRQPPAALSPSAALREVSMEHLERSKLVVLGLAARDPQTTRSADWQYERQLAGTLLPETRLYRMTAQQRGIADVAHVMRDLETVLLEASMSDGSDRDSLPRVQHLIARRGLVSRMQVVTTAAPGL